MRRGVAVGAGGLGGGGVQAVETIEQAEDVGVQLVLAGGAGDAGERQALADRAGQLAVAVEQALGVERAECVLVGVVRDERVASVARYSPVTRIFLVLVPPLADLGSFTVSTPLR